jgi:SAM-dependent methyltransferase
MMAMNADEQVRPGRAAEQGQHDGWASGDVSQFDVATAMVAECLCESIDLRPGQTVLDVGTGCGNAALAAARRGCEPCGVDSAADLLDRARERARAERLRARFQLGDAQAIPFPDSSFDVVLSVFGVMVAPDQSRAATELLRVCRPGGTVGVATWAAEGFIGTILQTTARHVPSDCRWLEPTLSGTEAGIRSLFGHQLRRLEVRRRRFIFRCRAPDYFLEIFLTHYGRALSALWPRDGAGRDALRQSVITVVGRFNRAEDDTMLVPADYLEVVTVKR